MENIVLSSEPVMATCWLGTASVGKGFQHGLGFYEGKLVKMEAKRERFEYEKRP